MERAVPTLEANDLSPTAQSPQIIWLPLLQHKGACFYNARPVTVLGGGPTHTGMRLDGPDAAPILWTEVRKSGPNS